MAVLKLNGEEMSKQNKKRKPSNQDFVNVINSLIQDMHAMQNDLNAFIGTFEMYIQMKNDADKLKAYVDKTLNIKQDELQKARQNNKDTVKANS